MTKIIKAEHNKDANEKLTWMSTLSQGIVLSTSNSAPSISKLKKDGKISIEKLLTLIISNNAIKVLVAHTESKLKSHSFGRMMAKGLQPGFSRILIFH